MKRPARSRADRRVRFGRRRADRAARAARALPHEYFIYLGDTARLPYGTKSGETVVRYAMQAGERWSQRGIKALVVACNTASAVALPALRERFAAAARASA